VTRINVVEPIELCDQHLLSEFRELVRIPHGIVNRRVDMQALIPQQYTMGEGHVRFFYDKCLWLQNRYRQLYNEIRRRGFDAKFDPFLCDNVPDHLMNDWSVTSLDREVNIARIVHRLQEFRRPARWTRTNPPRWATEEELV